MKIHENMQSYLEDYTQKYLDRIIGVQNGSVESFIENYIKQNSIK